MTKTKSKTPELSPACQVGMCGLCPGDGVSVYAPGKRRPFSVPLFTYYCDHGCRHGRIRVPREPGHP